MTYIYLAYNPFKLETTVLIDGEKVKGNSVLNVGNKRLQEWVNHLPTYLYEECNENEFKLRFKGTRMDYEDVEEVVMKARRQGIIIHLTHSQVQEIERIEEKIEELFNEIIEGPVEELITEAFETAFKQAMKKEFEVTLISKMDAGKSTLINAMLQQELMRSGQKKSKAIISEIKGKDKETVPHQSSKESSGAIEGVTIEKMTNLHDENLSMITLQGDIRLKGATKTSLVLIDTQGPNDLQNENQFKMICQSLFESSESLVLYVMDGTEIGVNEELDLLDAIAEKMGVGNKQSKDRCIFIVNKVVPFKEGKNHVKNSLEKVRKQLINRGIDDPIIIPVAFLQALDIRQVLNHSNQKGNEIIDKKIREIVKSFNQTEEFHLETLSPLPQSIHREIESHLENVDKSVGSLNRALIHTGVPGIEQMIKLHIYKYARAEKVKHMIDILQEQLEDSPVIENIEKYILEQFNRQNDIKQRIQEISEEIQCLENFRLSELEREIENINPMPEIQSDAKNFLLTYLNQLSIMFRINGEEKLKIRDVEKYTTEIVTMSEKNYVELSKSLDNMIEEKINEYVNQSLNTYQNGVKKFMGETDYDEVVYNSLNLEREALNYSLILEKRFSNVMRVPNGFEANFKFIINEKSGELVHQNSMLLSLSKMDNKEFIWARDLNSLLLPEVERKYQESVELSCKEAVSVINDLKSRLMKEIIKKKKEINETLRTKEKDRKQWTDDEKRTEGNMRVALDKLKWLKKMKSKVHEIGELKTARHQKEEISNENIQIRSHGKQLNVSERGRGYI